MRQLRWYLAPTAVAVVGLVILVYGAMQIDTLLKSLETAATDNTTWRLSQMEVDLLKFEQELLHAKQDGGSDLELDRIRTAGNIFLSRLDLIRQMVGPQVASQNVTAPGRGVTAQWVEIQHIYGMTAAMLDADNATLRESIPKLQAEINLAAPHVRQFALGMLMSLVAQAEAGRKDLTAVIWKSGIGSLLVIVLLISESWLLIGLMERLKLRTEASERNRMTLLRMVEASLDAMIVTDRNGVITSFNPAAEAMFGYEAAEANGKFVWDVIVPTRLRATADFRIGGFGGGDRMPLTSSERTVLPAMRKDGSEFPVEAAIVPGRGDGGEPIFFSFLRDVSERMQIERNLKDARDAALRSEEAKTRFLAVVSHEMRTPLNGLVAALDLLIQTTKTTVKQAKFLGIARESGTLALEHVDELLEVIRLSHGRGNAGDLLDFGLKEVLSGVTEQSGPLAAENGDKIVLDAPDIWLFGNRRLFLRVVRNLVGNAIKFTRSGLIRIRATVTREGESLVVRVEVSDTGIGIPAADQERIFDDFETLDSSYRRTVQGSGLGIGIAKRAVEHMGGEIGVHSLPGVGSTFWFTAVMAPGHPNTLSAPGAAEPADEGAGKGAARALCVLVVEDNATNRIVLREMLEYLGHAVTEATNGQEAIDRACEGQFDIIFMDVSMPVLDGVSATREIRDRGLADDTPIIGLTAFVDPSEVEKFHEAGMQTVLSKPLRLDALRDFLRGFARGHPADPSRDEDQRPGDAEEEVIDRSTISELRSLLGPDLFDKSRDRFLAEIRDFLGQIAAATERADTGEVAAVAHRGAGSSGAFGATQLWLVMQSIVADARAGNLPQVREGQKAATLALERVERLMASGHG